MTLTKRRSEGVKREDMDGEGVHFLQTQENLQRSLASHNYNLATSANPPTYTYIFLYF